MMSTLSILALKFHKKSSAVLPLWIRLQNKNCVRALCSSFSRTSSKVL